jgi:hypothetical protein
VATISTLFGTAK